MKTQSIAQKPNWSLVYVILGLSISFFASVYLMHGFTEASVRVNIRWSAKFSILCFSLAFMATSADLLLRNSYTMWLVKNRRYLGVSFAIIHLIHLFFLVQLERDFHPVFTDNSLVTLTLGGLAYLFIIVMLLTSFEMFSKFLSKKNWKRLHTIGGYWILIVFSNSILGRVFEWKLAHIPFALLILGTWTFRFLAWRKALK